MFGRKKKQTVVSRCNARLLRLERLEPRQMLSVNIITTSPGMLTLLGDNFGNGVTVAPSTSVGSPNSFTITGNGQTQLRLNGVPTSSPYTAAGVTGDISVNLG